MIFGRRRVEGLAETSGDVIPVQGNQRDDSDEEQSAKAQAAQDEGCFPLHAGTPDQISASATVLRVKRPT